MIVSAMNQKGGVGKTSTCYHLAGTLALDGAKVLLVDNDPQASLTQSNLGPDRTRDLPPTRTVASVYSGENPDPDELIIPVEGLAGVDMVPSGGALNAHNLPDPFALDPEHQAALARWLQEVSARYSVVFIDCPPNLCLCSWASLLAADAVIVPVQPEDFGAQGLGPIRSFGHAARQMGNPDLRMLGYLITMYDSRPVVHRSYEAMLRDTYGDLVFTSKIPRRSAFADAITHRRPVSHHEPKGAAAAAMREVAAELMTRFASTEPGGGIL